MLMMMIDNDEVLHPSYKFEIFSHRNKAGCSKRLEWCLAVSASFL